MKKMTKMKTQLREELKCILNDLNTSKVEQKQEHSVEDTQFLDIISQQIRSVNIETITIKDVFDLISQNINPLIEEDLKKILDQSTLQAKLYDNPVLVSVDEI